MTRAIQRHIQGWLCIQIKLIQIARIVVDVPIIVRTVGQILPVLGRRNEWIRSAESFSGWIGKRIVVSIDFYFFWRVGHRAGHAGAQLPRMWHEQIHLNLFAVAIALLYYRSYLRMQAFHLLFEQFDFWLQTQILTLHFSHFVIFFIDTLLHLETN